MQIKSRPMSADLTARRTTPLEWAAWMAAFALAYAQAPLYTSNQNQYFLHGLARAGYGKLASDWLVGTLDPTPLFSALVTVTHSTFGGWFFYVEYGLLMGVYLISLWSIARSASVALDREFRPRLLLAALVLLHSQAFRYVLGRIPGEHWEYLFEAGVAGQRVLGPVLQPSSFGVFLLASLALFLRRRPVLGAAAAALAASFHPTYLLPAAGLTASFIMVELGRTGGWRAPLTVGGTALVLATPITLYTWRVFAPTGPDTWRLAAEILVEFRIPHHAIPAQWFDLTVVLKVFLIAAGLYLVRRFSDLAIPMAILAAIAALLTAVQLGTGSLRLSLLMPWRLSALLVPIATGLLAWRVTTIPGLISDRTRAAAAILTGVAALAGTAAFLILNQRQSNAPYQQLFDTVSGQLEPNHRYLIPPKLQEFRIGAGTSAFVDFKSIPYQDREVIEWYERVRLAQFFYRDDPSFIDCGLLESIREHEPITHVVLASSQFGLECDSLAIQYQDDHYALYELRP